MSINPEIQQLTQPNNNQTISQIITPTLYKVQAKIFYPDFIDINFEGQFIAYYFFFNDTVKILKRNTNDLFIFHQAIKLPNNTNEISIAFAENTNRLYISYTRMKQASFCIIFVYTLNQNGFWEEDYNNILQIEYYMITAMSDLQFSMLSKQQKLIITFDNMVSKSIEIQQILDYQLFINMTRQSQILAVFSYRAQTIIVTIFRKKQNKKWKKAQRIQLQVEYYQIKLHIANSFIYFQLDEMKNKLICFKPQNKFQLYQDEIIQSELITSNCVVCENNKNSDPILIAPQKDKDKKVREPLFIHLIRNTEVEPYNQIMLPINFPFNYYQISKNMKFLYCFENQYLLKCIMQLDQIQ